MVQVTMALSLATFDLRVWMHSSMSITSATARNTHNHRHISKCAPNSRPKRSSIACFWRKSCAQAPTSTALLQGRIPPPSLDRLRHRTLSGRLSSARMEDISLLADKTGSYASGRYCQMQRSGKRMNGMRAILQAKQSVLAHLYSNKSRTESITAIHQQSWTLAGAKYVVVKMSSQY